MRRKAVYAVGAACAMIASVLLVVAAPADAQNYPPGCVSPSQADAGSVPVGGTITIDLDPGCDWNPGTPLTVTVNGTTITGKVASSNGHGRVVITVISATQLSVDDPVLAPGQCGTNTVVASGASNVARGGTSTHTETFTVVCPASVATPTAAGTKSLSLTGANLARWAAIALGLIVIGGLFVAADRRKARSRD